MSTARRASGGGRATPCAVCAATAVAVVLLALAGCTPTGFDLERRASASTARHLGKPATTGVVSCTDGRQIIDGTGTYNRSWCSGPFGASGEKTAVEVRSYHQTSGTAKLYVFWPGTLLPGDGATFSYLPHCFYRKVSGVWQGVACGFDPDIPVPDLWR